MLQTGDAPGRRMVMHMKRRNAAQKHIVNSSVIRLIVLLVLFLVPVDVLTLALSYTAIRRVESQISLDTKTALERNMGQIDYSLRILSRNMYFLATQDSDFERVNAKMGATVPERQEELHSIAKLGETLSDTRINHPWLGTIYVYFPRQDYFVDSKNYSLQNAACRTYIRALTQTKDLNTAHWQVCAIDGTPMLLRVMRYKNAYYGAWVSLDELRRNMGLDKTQNLLFFTDDQARIQVGADDALLEQDVLTDGTAVSFRDAHALCVTAPSTVSDLVLIELLPRDDLRALTTGIRVLQMLAFAALLAVPVFLFCLYIWIAKPINRLSGAIAEIETGNMDYRIEETPVSSEFDRINRNFNDMMDQVKALKINAYEQELEKNSIRMRYLSQQIQPHFILNALNIIYSLEADEYPLIQDMVLCLSKYFRYIVKANSNFVYLSNEFAHIENYFHIQKARYPKRFRYSVTCESGLEHCLIPPLIVQNFAENAIKHSISSDRVLGITLTAESGGDGTVLIRLCDTGAGVSDEILDKLARFRQTREPQEGLGLGFQNSVERLMVLYENLSTLNIRRGADDTGTVVEIVIPKVIEELAEEAL